MQKDRGGYELRFEEQSEFLVARVSAPEDTIEVRCSFLREIGEACRRTQRWRVLIIEDIETNLSALQMYEVATRSFELGARGLWIAYVDLKADHHDRNLFGETVAVNRGVMVKVFRNVPEAARWLLDQAASEKTAAQGGEARRTAPTVLRPLAI